MPRLATKDSRGRKRGGSAASKLYIESAVMVRPVGKAKVVLVPVTGRWLAAGAASLVAVVGGVKLAAWGGAWRPDSKRVERSG